MQILKFIEYKLARTGIEMQNRDFLCNLTVYFVVESIKMKRNAELLSFFFFNSKKSLQTKQIKKPQQTKKKNTKKPQTEIAISGNVPYPYILPRCNFIPSLCMLIFLEINVSLQKTIRQQINLIKSSQVLTAPVPVPLNTFVIVVGKAVSLKKKKTTGLKIFLDEFRWQVTYSIFFFTRRVCL